jgi:hypothetical protein
LYPFRGRLEEVSRGEARDITIELMEVVGGTDVEAIAYLR